MENYKGFKAFDIREPDDEDHLDCSYGGEIEPWWESSETESLMQEADPQSLPASHINRFRSAQYKDQEKMRQRLANWLMICFPICIVGGLIDLVVTKNGMLLGTILSFTGVFGRPIARIFYHYFHHPKK